MFTRHFFVVLLILLFAGSAYGMDMPSVAPVGSGPVTEACHGSVEDHDIQVEMDDMVFESSGNAGGTVSGMTETAPEPRSGELFTHLKNLLEIERYL